MDRQEDIWGRFSAYFEDDRLAEWTGHSAVDLLRQRVFALALGHEDLNDHDG